MRDRVGRGRLFVISGPSGVGKGTVVQALLDARSDLRFAVSYTTREPRPGEVDGVHYRFVDEQTFDAIAGAGGFLEWAEIFGHRSGTPAADVEGALEAGGDVLLEVDVQGARSVREKAPDAVLIFLTPPSDEELERRLRERGTEGASDLRLRMSEAKRELAAAPEFDHVVVNDQVDRAVGEVLAIIEGSKERKS
ncbi:MAG: guanylate kinase [Actinomycetota bacterium]